MCSRGYLYVRKNLIPVQVLIMDYKKLQAVRRRLSCSGLKMRADCSITSPGVSGAQKSL